MSAFKNSYEDVAYATAYAKLEFPGTYYLAFRDLPEILAEHAPGTRALDFGCGAGRSTRFLRRLGFNAVGADIANDMIRAARAIDPIGDYRLTADGDLGELPDETFDVALSAFTFDNVPTRARKVRLFLELARTLKSAGCIVNLVSAPEIYHHEWMSFSTRDYPENRDAKNGDEVRIINTAIEDRRPAIDVLWTDEAYRETYEAAGLRVIDVRRPLGRPDEPFDWINETTIAPWVIYVLGKKRIEALNECLA